MPASPYLSYCEPDRPFERIGDSRIGRPLTNLPDCTCGNIIGNRSARIFLTSEPLEGDKKNPSTAQSNEAYPIFGRFSGNLYVNTDGGTLYPPGSIFNQHMRECRWLDFTASECRAIRRTAPGARSISGPPLNQRQVVGLRNRINSNFGQHTQKRQ